MDSLVIGASGQVGQCVMAELAIMGYEHVGTCQSRCIDPLINMSLEGGEIGKWIVKNKPRLVFLCAALTNVDYCEQFSNQSFMTNVIGTMLIVHACRTSGSKLIFTSTDYVFDGYSGPYVEISKPNPINVLGKDKLLAEQFILDRLPNALVARITWAYSHEKTPPGKNFVQRLVTNARNNRETLVPTDQIGSPTYCPDIAMKLVTLAINDYAGIIHVAGAQRMSRYDFALQVAEVFELDRAYIRGASTNDLPKIAKRPLNCGMLSDRTGLLLGAKNGLMKMAEELKSVSS